MPSQPEAMAQPQKKPYVKPQVQQVPLRPEEAVLGSCKIASVSGPGNAECGPATPCSTVGS